MVPRGLVQHRYADPFVAVLADLWAPAHPCQSGAVACRGPERLLYKGRFPSFFSLELVHG